MNIALGALGYSFGDILLDPSVPHQTVAEEVSRHWRRVDFGEEIPWSPQHQLLT